MPIELTPQQMTLAAVAAGAAIAGGLAYWAIRSRQRSAAAAAVPEVVGKVKSIVLYPVKSTRGIELQSVKCLMRGFKYDRRFVIVNTSSENPPEGTPGSFLNLLNAPKLALIQPALEEVEGNATLILTADGHGSVRVLEPDPNGERVSLHVYRTNGEALDCGDEAAAWLAVLTGLPGARLYYMHEDVMPRHIAKDAKWGDKGRPGQVTSFANFAPYMLSTQQSLVDISTRVGQELEMARFRANIIVECSKPSPFQEDNWENLQIAGVSFYTMKQCGRCPMTTLDPNTGEKTGPEPLSTLKEYRINPTDSRYANSPIFGIQMGSENEGVISVGDDVIVR